MKANGMMRRVTFASVAARTSSMNQSPRLRAKRFGRPRQSLSPRYYCDKRRRAVSSFQSPVSSLQFPVTSFQLPASATALARQARASAERRTPKVYNAARHARRGRRERRAPYAPYYNAARHPGTVARSSARSSAVICGSGGRTTPPPRPRRFINSFMTVTS